MTRLGERDAANGFAVGLQGNGGPHSKFSPEGLALERSEQGVRRLTDGADYQRRLQCRPLPTGGAGVG